MLLLVVYAALSSSTAAEPLFFESFSDDLWQDRWRVSSVANVTGRWTIRQTDHPQAIPNETMIFTDSESAYFGLSHGFSENLDFTDKPLILQYEVRFPKRLKCAGAYIKLFSDENFWPSAVCNETKYVLMFGPDRCEETRHVRFIFRHKSLVDGTIEEKHMTDPPKAPGDTITHLYTLIVRPDNSFEIMIDAKSVKSGSLLSDFSPAVNPPRKIDDPEDIKPADWSEEKEIEDMDAKEPADWDKYTHEYIPDPNKLVAPADWLQNEPRFIPDPDAKKPRRWDDSVQGPWKPKMIPNPKCVGVSGCGKYEPPPVVNRDYKGKWVRPKIKNPNYRGGPWKARQILNENYVEDPHPHNFMNMTGIGFEVWIIDRGIGFGNVYIGHDEMAMRRRNMAQFKPRNKKQQEASDKLSKEEEASWTEKDKERLEQARKDRIRKTGGSLVEFGRDVKAAFVKLLDDNPQTVMAVVSGLVAAPVLHSFVTHWRRRQARLMRRKNVRIQNEAAKTATTNGPQSG